MSILSQMPSEAKIRSIIRKIVFKGRLKCPHCNAYKVRSIECRFYCRKCRRKFSLISSSWLSGMKISYTQVWILMSCWQKRLSVLAAEELAGVSHVTVRRWYRRFRNNIPYKRDNKLWGHVEIDEAFFGKRRTGNQRIVIGAYERSTGKVRLDIIPNRREETTDNFILDNVKIKSTVYTDAWSSYAGIDKFFGYTHEVCNHSQYVFGPTNRIEGVWSNLKRFIRRTYQQVRGFWLPFLLQEYEARVNAPELFSSPLNFLNHSLLFHEVS